MSALTLTAYGRAIAPGQYPKYWVSIAKETFHNGAIDKK
ncbi:MAG: hypothetical protein ACJAZF_000285 [Granulosicoccus sp.]|jgi:hypothetical protein